MDRIFKYVLEITDQQTVTMPDGGKLLAVQEQHGAICLWAQVDPSRRMVDREIFIYGTGHPMPIDPGVYVGTFQTHGGAFVGHVYDATASL